MNPEKSGETNLPAFLGRQEKTRLTKFLLKKFPDFYKEKVDFDLNLVKQQ